MKRILLATDFADASMEALRYSRMLAQTQGAALEILHVVPDPAEEPWSQDAKGLDAREIADEWVRAAQAKLRTLGCQCRPLHVDVAVRVGSITHQLFAHLAEARADLVAIGIANAEHARLPTIGLIAERLLRKAPCPVLAVPAGHGSGEQPIVAPWPRNILVPTDFSEHAHAAMTLAWELGQRTDATVQVLHVNDLLWHESPIETLRQADTIEGARRLLDDQIAAQQRHSDRPRLAYPLFASGEPAREILACADRIAADLIVVGTHGRGQVGRFLLGSVTQEVLEHTTRPVLVTRRH